jgi:broad specificity phosphatase PhoE
MIYFVRHGETISNVKLIFSNHGRTRLTKRGVEQAQHTAQELKDIEFDYVICSPLTRARQTMREILALQKGKQKVIYDNRLVERKYGSYTNKSIYLIKENRLDINYIPPENSFESCQDMIGRAQDFLNSIVEFGGKNILVVAHMEIGCALGYCLSKDKSHDLSQYACKNAEYKTYEF